MGMKEIQVSLWTGVLWREIQHAVIEGMLLAAYATGADEGYILCKCFLVSLAHI